MHLAASKKAGGLYNIGSGKARTWLDVARAVFAALKRKPKIEFIEMPEAIRDKYQYFTQANLSRLRAAGYTAPVTLLEDAVSDYVRNYLLPDQAARSGRGVNCVEAGGNEGLISIPHFPLRIPQLRMSGLTSLHTECCDPAGVGCCFWLESHCHTTCQRPGFIVILSGNEIENLHPLPAGRLRPDGGAGGRFAGEFRRND